MRKLSRLGAEQPPQTLLAGKLTAPLLQPGVVTRNRLLDVLDETRRLCLVVAPAGWGKTTLLTEWARQAGDHVAWLTLDETDDEPHRFWTYVVTALRTAAPDLGGDALAALRVPGIDPLEIAVPALLNDLSASEARHALILDDYHSCRSSPRTAAARPAASGELRMVSAASLSPTAQPSVRSTRASTASELIST
ncbi:MAG: ATP-dependent transcriptional regulator, MalT-like, LuxR family [Propionibacteriaceae bacterium]|nr:ATP-dependent transcriptional regulator, MalT-like, LuxR family [Propionibacteriaceae bacterium]